MTMERQRDLLHPYSRPDGHPDDEASGRPPQLTGALHEIGSPVRTVLGLLIGSTIGCGLWAIIIAVGIAAWLIATK